MAYRIRHRDSTAQASLRRIARGQVEAAIRSIDAPGCDAAAAIHDVRKRCKKIRGLLRLVRPAFDGYRGENKALRDIAAPLGPLRDADVLVATFDQVVDAVRPDDAATFAPVRRQLQRHHRTVADAHDPDVLLRTARDSLQLALTRIETWALAEDGFDAFAGGLKSSYRRGRKAMRAACRDGGNEAFHAWRKRCKDHTFHLRLLQPVWPGPMQAQRACAAELGDALGLHHDLAVLAAHIRGTSGPDRGTIDALVTRIHARQHELAARAGSLGARLYAESPAALAKSWRRRHAAWRREP